MIEVCELTKRYRSREALTGVSFVVPGGETMGFLGPNGAGKTTAMRCMLGLLPFEEGSVAFHFANGDRIENTWPSEARRRVAYLPEHPPCHDGVTVRGHIQHFARLNGLSGDELDRQMERVLDAFDLHPVADRMAGGLSKGNRQRAALAWTLVHDPEIVILDEPFSGLDPAQRAAFRGLLAGLEGKTVLLSSHSLPEIEPLCDRLLVLKEGRVIHETAPQREVQRLLVRVQRPDDRWREALLALNGVQGLEESEDGFVLSCQDSDELRSQVVTLSAEAGLVELSRRSLLPELERLFTTSRESDNRVPEG